MLQQVDDLPPAPGRGLILLRKEADGGDAKLNEGDPEEDEREQKAGRGNADKGYKSPEIVEDRVLIGGRVDADRHCHQPDKEGGQNRDDRGQWNACGQNFAYRLYVSERCPEIAFKQNVGDPEPVLLRQRLVQPVELAQSFDLLIGDLRACRAQAEHLHIQYVAGGKLDQDKGDNGNDHEQRNQQHYTPTDELCKHGCRFLYERGEGGRQMEKGAGCPTPSPFAKTDQRRLSSIQ